MQYEIPVTQPTIDQNFIDEYHKAVDDILRRKMLSNFGPWCERFENGVKAYIGNGVHVVSFSSADIALLATVRALSADSTNVYVPSFTFNSTANVILWNNLNINFIDVDKKTFLPILPDNVAGNDLILLTHTFGNVNHSYKSSDNLMYDGAHAFGAKDRDGNVVSSNGIATIFSFSGTKSITSCEGGVVVTSNETLADKLRYMRNYGFMNDYITKHIGLNGKMSELHAAFGTIMLSRIDEFMKARRERAERYKDLLCQFVDVQEATTKFHAYKDFAILVKNPDDVKAYLEQYKIQSKRYFHPLHKMQFYNKNISLPNTEYVYSKILCIPMFAHLSEEDQDIVVKRIKEAIK